MSNVIPLQPKPPSAPELSLQAVREGAQIHLVLSVVKNDITHLVSGYGADLPAAFAHLALEVARAYTGPWAI